ncbi:unnamed protein product [Orchesella dallaii]|uniref:Uncharacterized protein n=1 Tax=Orchesella dallaii TaxID=48710 RepID=A0ABP1S1Q2_9HEXA
MALKICIVTLVVVVYFRVVITQDSTDLFQEEGNEGLPNITLETEYDNNTGWKFPSYNIPKWFEYYNDTSHLKAEANNESSCGSITNQLELPSEANGIWVACQDPALSGDQKECALFKDSCHPVMLFDTGTQHTSQLRTIKISFALRGLAILRFSAAQKCFDYTLRQDPFSPCEFLEINSATVNDDWSSTTVEENGWIKSHFIFSPYDNKPILTFSLELISRFAKDVVLIDKVEGSQYILCTGDDECTTTTRATTTGNTTTTSSTTTTTEEGGITDPDVGFTSTTQRSASTLLISGTLMTIFSVLILRIV